MKASLKIQVNNNQILKKFGIMIVMKKLYYLILNYQKD